MTNPTQLGFGFEALAWCWLLPPLWLLLWALRRRRGGIEVVGCGFVGGEFIADLPRNWRARCSWLPAGCEALAVAALLVALAQPVERRATPPAPPGRDLLLCLDRSSSMAAEDLAPGRTRFDIGRELALQFVAARSDDRIGFVTFGRYADLRCPPTTDHAALSTLLQRVAMVGKEGPEDATAIGAAVATAAVALRRAQPDGRVIVLVTDGEENVALHGAPREIAPLHAAQLCAGSGIRVHTVVVGKGSQRADGSFAPLDTTAVQQLATTTGGRFFTAGDVAALRAVYAAIDALEAAPSLPAGVVIEQWFALPIAVAVLLLIAGELLAVTWLRRLP